MGNTKIPFCLQSCVKPLTYAISISTLGTDYVHKFVGKEPSGLRYNKLSLNEEGEHSLGSDLTQSCPLSMPPPQGCVCVSLPFLIGSVIPSSPAKKSFPLYTVEWAGCKGGFAQWLNLGGLCFPRNPPQPHGQRWCHCCELPDQGQCHSSLLEGTVL